MAWARALGGRVARAIRGRISALLGRAATATGLSLAIGAGTELAGIAIAEYQLQSLINDLPRAMDEMMKAIADNRVLLDRIRTALLRTRIQSVTARFVGRVAELRGFRVFGTWFAVLILMQQFSILVTDVFKAIWDVTIARLQRFALVDFSDQQYERVGDMSLQNLLNEWRTKDPTEIAQINLKEFIDLQNDLTALSTYFDAIGRTSALGQWLGFSALARTITNVSWAFGIGWLSWVAVGPGMRATIAAPLEKYYNKLLRQTDLPRETVLRFWKKGLIDDEELREKLAVLGISDHDIELLKKDELEQFTEAQVIDMLELGIVDEAEARRLLERLGWRGEELNRRLELAVTSAKAKLKERWINKLESAYVDGLVSLSDIENARRLDLRTVNLDQLKGFILNLEQEIELARLKIKTFTEQFMDGTIDEETLRARLSEIIVVPAVLEAVVENLKARKQPKVSVSREETLERRRRTLENRLELLALQIRHQERLMSDALAVIDARIRRLIAERDAQVRRIRALADARISALRAEFEAFRNETADRIEARIAEIRAVADARVREALAELEARKAAIDEEIEVVRAATLFEVEERIEMLRRVAETQTGATQERTLIRIEFLEAIKDLPVLRREAMAEIRKRQLEALTEAEVERIRAVAEAAEALLREMARVRIEEREAVLSAMVARIQEETEARIRELMERTEARLQALEEERRKTESGYRARIEALSLRADQVREELEVVQEALARRR